MAISAHQKDLYDWRRLLGFFSSFQTPMVNSAPSAIKLLRTSESEQLKKIRHTTSHVLAMAVQKLFPQAQVTIGPWTETGFLL